MRRHALAVPDELDPQPKNPEKAVSDRATSCTFPLPFKFGEPLGNAARYKTEA